MGNPWVNGKFTYDMSDNLLFKKDEENYIDALGIQQLNTIGNIYFLDIYLSANNYVDLHYHPNASELTYCISGGVEVSFINPNTNEWQQFNLKRGDVVSIPQGFWHCARATEDNTHLLATHDTNNLQTIFGSDILRITPAEVMADIYCLDESELAHVLQPIDKTIVIGPPVDCTRPEVKDETEMQEEIEEAQKEMLEKEKPKPKESRVPMFPIEEASNMQQHVHVTENRQVERNNPSQNEQLQQNHDRQQVYTCPICKGKQYRNK